MPKYRLTQQAEHDLLNIALYGIEQFGGERFRRYYNKLQERFDKLGEQPELLLDGMHRYARFEMSDQGPSFHTWIATS